MRKFFANGVLSCVVVFVFVGIQLNISILNTASAIKPVSFMTNGPSIVSVGLPPQEQRVLPSLDKVKANDYDAFLMDVWLEENESKFQTPDQVDCFNEIRIALQNARRVAVETSEGQRGEKERESAYWRNVGKALNLLTEDYSEGKERSARLVHISQESEKLEKYVDEKHREDLNFVPRTDAYVLFLTGNLINLISSEVVQSALENSNSEENEKRLRDVLPYVNSLERLFETKQTSFEDLLKGQGRQVLFFKELQNRLSSNRQEEPESQPIVKDNKGQDIKANEDNTKSLSPENFESVNNEGDFENAENSTATDSDSNNSRSDFLSDKTGLSHLGSGNNPTTGFVAIGGLLLAFLSSLVGLVFFFKKLKDKSKP
ncbi:MAG: hypothetical protein LBF33_03350 [Oscillospiraceae bacterium]|jgi:hypothetical protein|nr:hypothetical protein [Oscillospiraceae bacterium]